MLACNHTSHGPVTFTVTATAAAAAAARGTGSRAALLLAPAQHRADDGLTAITEGEACQIGTRCGPFL